MKVLITGGAGYIGSHVADRYARAHHDVVVYDNLVSTGPNTVSPGKLIIGSITDREYFDNIVDQEKPDMIIHLAALSDVGDSNDRPMTYYQNNIIGTMNVLDAVANNNVKHLLFASSSTVYEPSRDELYEHNPLRPISAYGRTKLACEHMIESFQAKYGFNAVNLRLFNAVGAAVDVGLGDRTINPKKLIPRAIDCMLNAKYFHVNGDIDQSIFRDFVDVTDIAQAFYLAGNRVSTFSRVVPINIGSGECHTVVEILEKLQKIAGLELHIEYGEHRPGDPPVTLADNGIADRLLGWQPHVDIDASIRNAWKFASGRVPENPS